MDKKETNSTFGVKINSSSSKKHLNSLNYKKRLKTFDVENHEREIRVRKVMDDLEDKQIQFKWFKKEVLILIIYLLAITAAEIVTAHYNVEYGLIMHTTILSALLINSSVTHSTKFLYLLRSMMILPMIRIIGLTIPLMQVSELYWFPVIAIPLFAASFVLMKSQKLTRKNVGLVLGNIPFQIAIALSGVVLGFIEYLILKPQPLISSLNLETVLFAGIILIISTGFAEELLFRGILQKNAEKILGKLWGLLYVSIIFTALHIGWNSTLDLLFVFSVALFYGYTFQKTGSLFGITFSHGISNTFLFLIMPFIFPILMPYINSVL
ncbi:MAG: type II CAAX endopeptidase family protein [Methanobacterium sp.]